MKLKNVLVTAGLLLAAAATEARATDATLSVDVSGQIKFRPRWNVVVGSSHTEASSLSLNFDLYATNGNYNTAVQHIELDTGTVGESATIVMAAPNGCKIGDADHTLILSASGAATGGVEHQALASVTQTFSILTGNDMSVVGVFGNSDNNVAGVVTCATPGSFTYSY